jgi:small subunit ribosomal protein S5
VIAGGSVRAVVELAGVKDILTKSRRSTNPVNVVKATFRALSLLQDPEVVLAKRKQLVEWAETTGRQQIERRAARTQT